MKPYQGKNCDKAIKDQEIYVLKQIFNLNLVGLQELQNTFPLSQLDNRLFPIYIKMFKIDKIKKIRS